MVEKRVITSFEQYVDAVEKIKNEKLFGSISEKEVVKKIGEMYLKTLYPEFPQNFVSKRFDDHFENFNLFLHLKIKNKLEVRVQPPVEIHNGLTKLGFKYVKSSDLSKQPYCHWNHAYTAPPSDCPLGIEINVNQKTGSGTELGHTHVHMQIGDHVVLNQENLEYKAVPKHVSEILRQIRDYVSRQPRHGIRLQ